ncbi:TauD/TfdA family dioxygenase [Nocardia brasiliensis]|uniref:TauD/TfdA family dioxygenase n=1 Tax=Nocardia brasiliensis TaxID=37326 RepID=UPI002458C795|nr:TauD/TfdA family dioxygenase [Nocardia brasiliensis]
MSPVDLVHVIDGRGTDLIDHIRSEREDLRVALRLHGALLFRGFAVAGVAEFETAVRALSGAPLAYSERSSPRSVISGHIYTSTDYPAREEIFFHNENSYQSSWPLTLFFYCVQPPQKQGATPLTDTRRVLSSIDQSVRDEFIARRWMVVRNYGNLLGLPWRTVFNTDSRSEVESYCAKNAIDVEWLVDDELRTRSVRDAVHRHPVTGESVWFNHATFFHVSTLPEPVRFELLEILGAANLPSNTYYGDGEPIPDEVAEHLRDCYRSASVRFDYQKDDLLVVDNMLVAHGREPFAGSREVAVAMAEPSTDGGQI